MSSLICGIDVGGANIKFCRSDGYTITKSFPLWKSKSSLPKVLAKIVSTKNFQIIGVTMTGELCDCFESKNEGIRFILNAIKKNSKKSIVWTTNQNFLQLEKALQKPKICAASNWLALAKFTSIRFPKGFGLSIDIGTTTTDITPIKMGKPVPIGKTDPERLKFGELVYTGIKRTPLSSFLGAGYAHEYFATIADAHLLMNNLDEATVDTDTSDGRPFTKKNSLRRVAKMLCADPSEISMKEIIKTSEIAIKSQVEWISTAIKSNVQRQNMEPEWVSISGSGEFLAKLAMENLPWNSKPTMNYFSEAFGKQNSTAACAFSVMKLAGEYHAT